MKPKTIETLIWVLVYGGLLTLSVGVFVLRGGAPALGWTLIGLGALAALAGAALVVLHARPAAPPSASAQPRRPPP